VNARERMLAQGGPRGSPGKVLPILFQIAGPEGHEDVFNAVDQFVEIEREEQSNLEPLENSGSVRASGLSSMWSASHWTAELH
jgi:hypothetical protein